MFGSDWPVCLLTADYRRVWESTHETLGRLTAAQHEKVFGRNASTLYRLQLP
jgi:L-fuconolactonase